MTVDGTQSISGNEPESVCLWFVDYDLVPQEVFIGLYEVSGTSVEEIAYVVADVLLNPNLPMSG